MFTFTHRNPEMRLDKEQTALVLADARLETGEPQVLLRCFTTSISSVR